MTKKMKCENPACGCQNLTRKAPANRESFCVYCGLSMIHPLDDYSIPRAHERNCTENPLREALQVQGGIIEDQHNAVMQLKKDALSARWFNRILGISMCTGIALHYIPAFDWFGQIVVCLILVWIAQKIWDRLTRPSAFSSWFSGA